MIEFVLDDPRLVTRELLVVGLQILVQVTHANRQRPRHVAKGKFRCDYKTR